MVFATVRTGWILAVLGKKSVDGLHDRRILFG